MKRCGKCKQLLPRSQFYKQTRSIDGLQAYCKKCNNARRVQYYQDNREKENRKRRERIHKHRLRLAVYKRTLSCEKCGESRWYVLDFHHPNGDKEHSVANMVKYGWDKVMAEIQKCQVFCSNCHREVHHTQRTQSIIVRVGEALAAVFGSDEEIKAFLSSPCPGFDNCPPSQLIERGEGELVAEMLEDMLLGHPS